MRTATGRRHAAAATDIRLTLGQMLAAEFEALHGVCPPMPDPAADATGPARPAGISDEEWAYRRVAADTPQYALCLSGGGIRSAAFCLGVVQALASKGLLARFHYLSTVSGGGFIGAWLSTLIHENGNRAEAAQDLLRHGSPPEPLRRLRNFTNYLTPHAGLFSSDSWTAGLLYLRNLLLNWLVFAPIFLGAVLVAVFYRTALWAIGQSHGMSMLCLLVAAIMLLVAVFFACLYLPSHRPREDGQPWLLRRIHQLPRAIGAPLRRFIDRLAGGMPDQRTEPGGVPYKAQGAITRGIVIPALAWAFLVPSTVSGWFLGGLGAFDKWLLPSAYFVITVGSYWVAALWQRGSHIERGIYWRNFGWWLIAGLTSTLLLLACLWTASQFINAADAPSILAVFGPLCLVLVHILQSTVHVALRREVALSDLDREWLARLSALLLRAALCWTGFAFCCLMLPAVTFHAQVDWPHWALPLGALLSGPAAAWLGKAAVTHVQAAATSLSKSERGLRVALQLLSAIFAIALFTALGALVEYALGQMQLGFAATLCRGGAPQSESCTFWRDALPIPLQLVTAAVMAALAYSVSRRINVNRFSLHAVYRNRLTRAFIGTARRERKPDRFTDFDPGDNLLMKDFAAAPGQRRLFPVVNMALNLTVDTRTDWSERRAAPFVMTPLACGSAELDMGAAPRRRSASGVFVPTADYAGQEHAGGVKRNAGVTLATAMTISGAAVSPNWGYHSSPVIAFLMTLFNVRLGAWLPNPAVVGGRTEKQRAELSVAMPSHPLWAMRGDLLGLATDDSRAIYLSDGGHFDNLGLYEMLRRRCRCILVVDAGEDSQAQFGDLGGAIRKVAIDLQIHVDIALPMQPRAGAQPGPSDAAGFAFGSIRYPDAPPGVLLYVKPTWLHTLPADVRAYGVANTAFPHEPTLDQWFTESQFESYRALGEFQARKLTDPVATEADIQALFAAAPPVPPRSPPIAETQPAALASFPPMP